MNGQGIPINIGLNAGPLMTGENTYFIGEDNVISIGTITFEKALREVTTTFEKPLQDDKSERVSILMGRSPSYNGDLSVDDISNNEISAIAIKNEPDDFVTPLVKKEDEEISKSALKRNQSV